MLCRFQLKYKLLHPVLNKVAFELAQSARNLCGVPQGSIKHSLAIDQSDCFAH